MKTFRLVAILLVTMAASPVVAHHSFSAEHDFNKPLKLKGKVVEMKWANPHAWIYIDVAGKDGKVEKWAGNWRGQRAVSTRLEKGRSGRRDRAGDRRLPGAQRIQDRQRDEHHLRERQASFAGSSSQNSATK